MGKLTNLSRKEYRAESVPKGELSFYPTGFQQLDLMIGKDKYEEKPDGTYSEEPIVKIRGLKTGCVLTSIGAPSTGKSTITGNIAGNILRPFDEGGELHYMSVETGGMTEDRLRNLTKFSSERYDRDVRIHPPSVCSIEFLESLVGSIIEDKLQNPDKFRYVGTNLVGEQHEMYKPTIIIVDSWSEIGPEGLYDKEISNAYHAMKANKNGVVLEKITKKIERYNIMIFMIAHITKAVSMDMFSTPKKIYKNMKHTDKIVGGAKIQFHTRVGIFFDKYEELKEDKINKILGEEHKITHVVKCVLWKNTHGIVKNDERSTMSMALHEIYGFDPFMGLVYDLMTKFDLVNRRKIKLLDGEEIAVKKNADVINLIMTDPRVQEKVKKLMRDYYSVYLDTRLSPEEKNLEKRRAEISDMLLF